MFVIGLTGGIGSGKSSVVQLLRELGACTLDADALGHECYAPGSSTLKEVVEAFGSAILNEEGGVNRKALGAIVFQSREQMEKLNAIMWPAILSNIGAKVQRIKEEGR